MIAPEDLLNEVDAMHRSGGEESDSDDGSAKESGKNRSADENFAMVKGILEAGATKWQKKSNKWEPFITSLYLRLGRERRTLAAFYRHYTDLTA